MYRTLLTLPLLLLLAGCGGDSQTGVSGRPSQGGMAQLDLSPECGALSQACIVHGLDAPIARGARLSLRLDFRLPGSSGPPAELRGTRPEVLAAEANQVHAAGEGTAAVLVVGPDDRVLDFIHLWVVAADELRATRYTVEGIEVGRIRDHATLLMGDELLLAFESFAAGQPLLGEFRIEWSIDGDAVAMVEDTLAGRYRLVTREPGTATVTVSAPDIEQTFQLHVEVE